MPKSTSNNKKSPVQNKQDEVAAGPSASEAIESYQLSGQNSGEAEGQQQEQQLAFASTGNQGLPINHGNSSNNNDPLIAQFWSEQLAQVQQVETLDFKSHSLPLARIKKVMKMDAEVRSLMISSELPILLGKACEIFILELTMKAWAITELNKRRTLQKNDVASAIAKSDLLDFLIDIVPRDTSIHASAPRRYPMAEEYHRAFGLSGAVNPSGNANNNGGALMLHPEYLYQQLYNSAAGGVANASDPNALAAYQQQLQQQYLQQQQQFNQMQSSQQFQQSQSQEGQGEPEPEDVGSSVIVSPQDDQSQTTVSSLPSPSKSNKVKVKQEPDYEDI